MGGKVGRRLQREGMYVYVQLIHFVVQQKLTQHCKAIIFHSRKKELNMPFEKWLLLGCNIHPN